MGADSRHAGLTCDALQSATVVLPSGDVVTASANDHPDLFWALRGGGGGNFGVTTSMTFATFATGDSDVVRINFPPSSAVQVLTGLAILAERRPTETRGAWWIFRSARASATAMCWRRVLRVAGSGVADAIKSAVGLQPTAVQNKTHEPYGSGDVSGRWQLDRVAAQFRGRIRRRSATVNSAAAHAIATAIGQWPANGGKASVLVDPLGGAVGDVDPGDSAFPWRKQSAVLQWYVEPAGNAGVGRNAVAELGTSSGTTVFGRGIRQLPGGQHPGVALLRLEPVAADHRPAEVRSQPGDVLRLELLRFNGRAGDSAARRIPRGSAIPRRGAWRSRVSRPRFR